MHKFPSDEITINVLLEVNARLEMELVYGVKFVTKRPSFVMIVTF
jgi:hypothetical protein